MLEAQDEPDVIEILSHFVIFSPGDALRPVCSLLKPSGVTVCRWELPKSGSAHKTY